MNLGKSFLRFLPLTDHRQLLTLTHPDERGRTRDIRSFRAIAARGNREMKILTQ